MAPTERPPPDRAPFGALDAAGAKPKAGSRKTNRETDMKRIVRAAALGLGLVGAGPVLALGICVEGAYPPFSETAPDGSVSE